MLATSNPINQKKGKNRRRNKKKQNKANNGDSKASISERTTDSTKNFEFQSLKEFQARVSMYALVSSLPSDVLKRISQHLYLQKDRHSFSLVNKTWHEAGNEALWYTPSFWSTSRFALFYRIISINAKLASQVNELNLVLNDPADKLIFFSEEPQHRLLRKSPIADPHIIQKLVKACKNLKQLHVYGWNFDDTSMKKVLSAAGKVTTLRVVGSEVLTQRPFLEASMSLQAFTIDANLQLNDLFVRISSSRFQSLKSLHLAASNISEKGFNILVDHIQNLQEFYIHHSPGFNDNIVEKLTRNCFKLQKISIQHCGITLSSLQLLVESNVNLKEIWLNLNIGDEDENSVSWMMPICENLELLSLENAMIDDDLLQNIGMHCPKIQELNLIQCKLITDDCIRFFSESLTGLRKIRLAKCENLTGSSLFSLLSLQRKSLRSITFTFNGEFNVTNETKNLLRNSPNLTEFKLEGYEDQISTKEWGNLLKRFNGATSLLQELFFNFISHLQESPENSRSSSPIPKETRKRDNAHENGLDIRASALNILDENSTKRKKKEPLAEVSLTQSDFSITNNSAKPEGIPRVIPWKEWGVGSEDSEEEKPQSPLPPSTPKVDKNTLQGSGKFGTIRKGDALSFLQQLREVPDILEPGQKGEPDPQYVVGNENFESVNTMDIPEEESESFVYDVEKGDLSNDKLVKQTGVVKFTYNPYATEFHYRPNAKNEENQLEHILPSALDEPEFIYSSGETTAPVQSNDRVANKSNEKVLYHAEVVPEISPNRVQFADNIHEDYSMGLTNSVQPEVEVFDYMAIVEQETFNYPSEPKREEIIYYDQDPGENEFVYTDANEYEDFVYHNGDNHYEDVDQFVYAPEEKSEDFTYHDATKKEYEFNYSDEQKVLTTVSSEEVYSNEFIYSPKHNEAEFIYPTEGDMNQSIKHDDDLNEEFIYSDVKQEIHGSDQWSNEISSKFTNDNEKQTNSEEFIYAEIKSELAAEPTIGVAASTLEDTEEFIDPQPMDKPDFDFEQVVSSPLPEEFVYSTNHESSNDNEIILPHKPIIDPIAIGDHGVSFPQSEERTPTNDEFNYTGQEELVYPDVNPQNYEDVYPVPELSIEDVSEPMNEIDEISDPEVWIGWKTEEEWKRISNNKLSATNVFFKNALSADEAEETLKSLKGYERMIHSAPGSTPGSKTQRQGALRKQLANFLAEASQIRNEKKEQIQYQTYLEGDELSENIYNSDEAMDWEQQARSVPSLSEYYHHNTYSIPYEEYIYGQPEPIDKVVQPSESEPALIPASKTEGSFQIQDFGSISTGFKFNYEQIMKEVESIPKSVRTNFAQKNKERVNIYQEVDSSKNENEFKYATHKYDNGVDEDADDEDGFDFDYNKIKEELSSDGNPTNEFIYASNSENVTAEEPPDNEEGNDLVEDEEVFDYFQYSKETKVESESPGENASEREGFNYLAEVESENRQDTRFPTQDTFDYLAIKSNTMESSDEEFSYMAFKEQSTVRKNGENAMEETFDYFEVKNEIVQENHLLSTETAPESHTILVQLSNDLGTKVSSAPITPADTEEFDYSAIKKVEKKIHSINHLQEHPVDTVPTSPFETSPSWEHQVFKEERKLFDKLHVDPIHESKEPVESESSHPEVRGSNDKTSDVIEVVTTVSEGEDNIEGFDYQSAVSQPESNSIMERGISSAVPTIRTEQEETFDYLQEKSFVEVATKQDHEPPSYKSVRREDQIRGDLLSSEGKYLEQRLDASSEFNKSFTRIFESSPISRNNEQIIDIDSVSHLEEYVPDSKPGKPSKSEHKVFGQASNILKSLLDQAHQSDVEKEQDLSSPEMDSKEDKKSRKKKKKEKELERKEKKEKREKEQEKKEKKEREQKEKEQEKKEKEKTQRDKQKVKKKQEVSLESTTKSTVPQYLHSTLQDSAIEQLLVQLEDKKENSSKEKKKEIQLDIDKVKSFTESSQDSLSTSTNGKTDEILNSILEMLGLNESDSKGNKISTNGSLIESEEVSLGPEQTPATEKKTKQDESNSLEVDPSLQPLENVHLSNLEISKPKEKCTNESTKKKNGVNVKEKSSTKSADGKIIGINIPTVTGSATEPKRTKSRSRSSRGKTLVRLDIETRDHGQQLLCVKEADHPDQIVERFCNKYELTDLMPGLLRYVRKIVVKKQKEVEVEAEF